MPKEITDFLKDVQDVNEMFETPPEQEGVFNALAGGAIEALRSGVADLPHVIQRISDVAVEVGKSQGVELNRIDVFERLANAIDPQDFTDKPTLARKIGRIIGGLAVAIPKYAPATVAGPAMIPAFGAIGAATAWGRKAPPEEILKQGAIDAAFGALLKGTGKLPRWERAGAMATGAPAIEAAATGGEAKPEDLILTGLTMGTLGAMGSRLPRNLESQLRKLGYPDVIIREMPIKDARRYVREKLRFQVEPTSASTAAAKSAQLTPTEMAEEMALPGRMRGDIEEMRDLAAYNQAEKELFLVEKILEHKGFGADEIAAMPYVLKLAIANSDHDARTIVINKLTGMAQKVAEPTRETAGTSQVMGMWAGYKGPKIEDLIVDTAKDTEAAAVVKEVNDRVTGITSGKLLAMAEEAGIESDVAAGMTPEELFTAIQKAKGVPVKKLRGANVVKARGAEVEAMMDFAKDSKETGLPRVVKLGEVEAPIPAVTGERPLPTTPTEAYKLGRTLDYNAAVGLWRSYLTDPLTQDQKTLIKVAIESFLGAKGKSLSREEIVDGLTEKKMESKAKETRKTRGRVKLSKLGEEMRAAAKGEVSAEKVSDPLVKAAMALGWKPEKLRGVDDTNLRLLVDAQATPEDASINPYGKVTLLKKGDFAASKVVGVEPTEVSALQAEGRLPTPDPDATLRAAAEWADMSYKLAATLPQEQKDLLISSYLDDIGKKVVPATKASEDIHKPEIKATQQHNEVLVKDTEANPSLAILEDRVKGATAKVEKKQRLYDEGRIDDSDLALAEQERIDAIADLEKKRMDLAKKSTSKLRKGQSEKIAYINEGTEGGVLVRKKISDTIDEFSLLTKGGEAGKVGESGITSAGKAVVEIINGQPVLKEFPESLNIPRQNIFRDEMLRHIKQYYNSKGSVLISKDPKVDTGAPTGGVKLRTGIDFEELMAIKRKAQERMQNIFRTLAARRDAKRRMPREDMDAALRDAMKSEKMALSDDEIRTMWAESLKHDIPKGEVPMVAYTDILGQAVASKNPDVITVQEQIALKALRARYLKDILVWDRNSKLNKIFANINARDDSKQLRWEVAECLMTDTNSKNPLVMEAVSGCRSLLDKMADVNELRARKVFINKYFPLIVDMENTYRIIRGMWNNTKTREDLPDRYKIKGEDGATVDFLIDDSTYKELKYIFGYKKEWKDLTRYEKNRIRYDALSFEGIYDSWAFLPEDVMQRIPKKSFNPHLQERKGGALAYKHDAYEVMRQYLLTMVEKESNNIMLKRVAPVINKYPRGDIWRSVRWYMDKQVKQALGTPTEAQRYISERTSHLNDIVGKEIIDPTWAMRVAGRLAGQTARGALGPDTALRNIAQSLQTVVNDGPLQTMRSLKKYIDFEYRKHKGTLTPEEQDINKFFKLLLAAEEYNPETGYVEKGLGARLAKAESISGKSLAFYDWLGDMALSPMRATEHFNKFLAFMSGLEDSARKGLSFEEGTRIGLLRSFGDPTVDLTIPDAYWNAYKRVLQSQYGYSREMRNPLMRGPLAKVSTIFWSYPANTIQFMQRGLIDSALQGEWGRFARFGLYTGFQLSIAAAMAQLGLDVGAIFGMGLLPISGISLPWKFLKSAYQTVAGKTAEDRSSGEEDFLDALGMLTIHQYRYGKKVIKNIKNLENGYITAGTREMPVMEMTPLIAVMDLTGAPTIGPRKTWDLVQQLRDSAWEYGKNKQKLVLRGIKAIEGGNMEDLRKVFSDAQTDSIVLTGSELSGYYRLHQQKTYLQTALERLPKHLRGPMQQKVRELEEALMPHRFEPTSAGRSMWSGPRQTLEEEEE